MPKVKAHREPDLLAAKAARSAILTGLQGQGRYA
jgi:hypothetical protein